MTSILGELNHQSSFPNFSGSTAKLKGGFSTVVASYLARARGSGEPELSNARVKDLDQFLRECQSFKLDHGHVLGNQFDAELTRYRQRFEQLLGSVNNTNNNG
jgi:hypothetical protein